MNNLKLEDKVKLNRMEKKKKNKVIALMEIKGFDVDEATQYFDDYDIYNNIDEFYQYLDKLVEPELNNYIVKKFFDFDKYHKANEIFTITASNGVVIEFSEDEYEEMLEYKKNEKN